MKSVYPIGALGVQREQVVTPSAGLRVEPEKGRGP